MLYFAWIILFLTVISVATPLASIVGSLLHIDYDMWAHLAAYVLPDAIFNTFIIVVITVILTAILGISSAWFIVAYSFPARRYIAWLLLLPLALPSYLLAFVYSDWVQYASFFPSMWRNYAASPFPLHRGNLLAVLVFSLSLYPYVYLMSWQAFLSIKQSMLDSAYLLGMSRYRVLSKVVLPLTLPWFINAALLVAMETLSDFGTVSIMNVDTLTTTLYKAWFGMFSKNSALQIASILLVFVLILHFFEMYLIAKHPFRYDRNSSRIQPKKPSKIKLCSMYCYFVCVMLFSSVLPLVQLCKWSWMHYLEWFDSDHLLVLFRTLSTALLSAVSTVFVAFLLTFALRSWQKKGRYSLYIAFLTRFCNMGYAVPGIILGIAFYYPFINLDRLITHFLSKIANTSFDTVLQGSLFVLIFVYGLRFLAVAYKPIDTAWRQITLQVEDSMHLLGVKGWHAFNRVYVPLLKGGVGTGLIFVMIDTLKDIPITLLLRPAGWDTLAVKIFEYTTEGLWEMAAFPALLMVLVGLPAVWYLFRQIWQENDVC